MVDSADADEQPSAGTGPAPLPLISTRFGDKLDWTSPLVELPFWLMVDDSQLSLPLGPAQIPIRVHGQHREVYVGEVLDSRRTLAYRGPDPNQMNSQIVQLAAEQGLALMERPSRTVLRLRSSAHIDVFQAIEDSGQPESHRRRKVEAEAYLATLCEAHIPVINDFIQRYRLSTYDHFAYEVSPWDVPCGR